ncbi:MAG: enhancing lycopene biosynthesis protein 2 [Chlamydiales bacterium]
MKVAVVLSGCGYLDGAEIHESVLCLLALAQNGHEFHCFAPDIEQVKVVNHRTGKDEGNERRNVLTEAARIARGDISPVSALRSDEFDALLIPGGFGVALNISSFAEEQENCSVNEDCKKAVLSFYKSAKPIGATCIAPAALGKIFQDVTAVTMTLGRSPDANENLTKMGMIAQEAGVEEMVADEKNKVFTTPAYMEPDDLAGMFKGIQKVIKKLEQYQRVGSSG